MDTRFCLFCAAQGAVPGCVLCAQLRSSEDVAATIVAEGPSSPTLAAIQARVLDRSSD